MPGAAKGPLKLVANPTFRGTVEIPTPEGPAKVGFEFKHVAKSKLPAFMDSFKEKNDTETLMGIATDWYDIDGEFNEENITTFCDQYHAAGRAIFEAYVTQLAQYKRGN